MKLLHTIALAATASLALAACDNTGGDAGGTREEVRVVGSSTVFPFAKKVAESFVQSNPGFASPLIESTGTGGGFSLFCEGLGPSTPDIANASRRMKASEFEDCQANGVEDIMEVQVGLDGIAFAAATDGISLNLTPQIVYEAIAANPYGEPQTNETWADVDPSLPNVPILVYGPPATSGTRDALKELVLEPACKTNETTAALKDTDEDAFDRICTELRSDGKYVDQGEQDNLIVQKISNNDNAVGVFGYSYLEENAQSVKGLPMNGVAPTYENISSFAYPGARPLYIYVKSAHIDAIPGLAEFLAEWQNSWGVDGPLTDIGLIASPDDTMATNAGIITGRTALEGSALK